MKKIWLIGILLLVLLATACSAPASGVEDTVAAADGPASLTVKVFKGPT